MFSAGCLSDDTGSGDGANDSGETTETSTEDKDTETTTEYTETETATATQDLPDDMAAYADLVTEELREPDLPDNRSPFTTLGGKPNRMTYQPAGESGDGSQYQQVIDIWVDDTVPAFSTSTPAGLAEDTQVDEELLWFIVRFSRGDSRFQDRVTEHVYRVQQGENYGEPFAELTVPPTYWADVKEQVREEREEGEATMKVAQDVFRPYFTENLDINA